MRILQSSKKQTISDDVIVFGLLALIFLIFFVNFTSYAYDDAKILYENSLVAAESYLRGTPLKFYEMSLQMVTSQWAANYSFLLYTMFAIWMLPIQLIIRNSNLDAFSVYGFFLWFKLILAVALAGTVIFVKKILKLLDVSKDTANKLLLLAMSSLYLTLALAWIGQVEIIACFFVMAGLYFLFKGNKILFLVFMAVSIPCKSFMALLVIPIVLLFEKNIWKAGLMSISTFSLVVLEKLLFINHPSYSVALNPQTDFGISILSDQNVYGVSTFILCYIAIIVICYLHPELTIANSSSSKEAIRPVFYYSFIVLAALMVLTQVNSYWVLLILPFAIVNMSYLKPKFFRAAIIVGTIGAVCFIFYIIASRDYALNSYRQVLYRGFISMYFPLPDDYAALYSSPYGMFRIFNLLKFTTIAKSVWTASIVVLAVLFTPGVATKYDSDSGKDVTYIWILLRAAATLVFTVVMFYAWLAPGNYVVFSNLYSEGQIPSMNLASDGGHTIRQEVTISENMSLNKLYLRFDNPVENNRQSFISLKISLVDTNGNTLWQETMGANAIPADTEYVFRLGGADVVPGSYYIVIEGIPGSNKDRESDSAIMPYLAPYEESDHIGDLFVDGEVIEDETLCFALA